MQSKGGFFAAVEAGQVQADMEATSNQRLKDVSVRKVLLGTNQFPNFNEQAAQKITDEACVCKCGCSTDGGLTRIATSACCSRI